MLYAAYQAQCDLTAPIRVASELAALALRGLAGPARDRWAVRSALATSEIVANWRVTHHRPPFRIDSATVDGREVAVHEEAVRSTPFGTLLRFRRDTPAVEPPVLIVAPLSGHFSTLLRATVRTMLADHDVYLTDWHNARDIPIRHGRFGVDEYIDHVIDFLDAIGPGAHVLAVCQPCVPALAAAALMGEDDHPARPHSITLMAGPIDTRVSPTTVNALASERSLRWFERTLIDTVPPRHRGAGRRVYPGFLQLTAFMNMNPDRHREALRRLYADIVGGNDTGAAATREFYDEYFAVLDLTAEFYLETVSAIFQEHTLARGALQWRGRTVNPAAMTRTSLLTVEGERDDICAPGQTAAAHDLCSGLPRSRRRRHLQAGVGHYGVFSGRRWEREVYPEVRTHILASQ